jgi:hypothetical protein
MSAFVRDVCSQHSVWISIAERINLDQVPSTNKKIIYSSLMSLLSTKIESIKEEFSI